MQIIDELNNIKAKLDYIDDLIAQVQTDYQNDNAINLNFTCMARDYTQQIGNDIEDIKTKYLF